MKKLFVSIIALAAISGAAYADGGNSDSGRFLASVTEPTDLVMKKTHMPKTVVVDSFEITHGDVGGFGIFSTGQYK